MFIVVAQEADNIWVVMLANSADDKNGMVLKRYTDKKKAIEFSDKLTPRELKQLVSRLSDVK